MFLNFVVDPRWVSVITNNRFVIALSGSFKDTCDSDCVNNVRHAIFCFLKFDNYVKGLVKVEIIVFIINLLPCSKFIIFNRT